MTNLEGRYLRYEGWLLRKDDVIAKSILIAWINGHTGVFKLINDIGCFSRDDVIRINMNTLEAKIYDDLFKEAV